MKKTIIALICSCIFVGLLGFFYYFYFVRGSILTLEEVKLAARRASVQVQFHIPVLKVYFSTPLPEQKKLTEADLIKILEEKIKQAIEAERELQKTEKYNAYLTNIETYYRPRTRTEIAIGSLQGVPKWAKFPSRVLTVYKTEKKELSAWEKEYEQDILTISETAGVSPSKAKEILINLKGKGYSVSKEKEFPETEIALLWFQSGWDASYPTELKWKVEIPGDKKNYIKGYDDRGILQTQLIPEDPADTSYNKRPSIVRVEAGYFDLKDEFKPKTQEVERMFKEIEDLKKQLQEKTDKEKRGTPKRDISDATWLDVRIGTVKAESFWIYTAASGVFIGNMKVRDGMYGYQWGRHLFTGGEVRGVVLTNAHVAQIAELFEIYVSKDKEKMWILFPGWPSVRYTQDSDMYGSPAPILCLDQEPVYSWDYDSGIMVTSAVPQYEKYKALLGNSDNVSEGDPIVTVGNPAYMQKFLSTGVVSNKNYSAVKSRLMDYWMSQLTRKWFNWLLNSTWWYDSPIGAGGTSGSGIWALSGKEKGKVVALHNMGMGGSDRNINVLSSAFVEIKSERFSDLSDSESFLTISQFGKKHQDRLFDKEGYKIVKFEAILFEGKEEYPKEMELHCGYTRHGGMNGAVPINPIKRFLQERGLDPANFGFDGASKEYWTK